MIKSEAFTKICTALVKAQQLIGGAQKNAFNPHFKNKYANLESVLQAISPALEVTGLAVIQSPLPSDDGKLHLETMIIHESGEFISGTLVMPLPKQDPQGYGSALTYARRYHLSSMLGVVQDDDDAATATASKGSPSSAADEMSTCENMKDLESVFKDFVTKFRDNPAAIRVITDAKDKRKAQIAMSVTESANFNPAKIHKIEKTQDVEKAEILSKETTKIEEF